MNREMDREKEEERYGDEKMEKCKKKKKERRCIYGSMSQKMNIKRGKGCESTQRNRDVRK